MMKRSVTLVLIICLSTWAAFGQDEDLKVVSTSGESFQTGSIQMDWTLGEIGAETLHNGVLVTGGFHQPNFIISDLPELDEDIGNIDIFPSPASEQISIILELKQQKNVDIQLYDLEGKLLWRKGVFGDSVVEQKEISSLSNGLYTMVFFIDGNPYAHTFSVKKN